MTSTLVVVVVVVVVLLDAAAPPAAVVLCCESVVSVDCCRRWLSLISSSCQREAMSVVLVAVGVMTVAKSTALFDVVVAVLVLVLVVLVVLLVLLVVLLVLLVMVGVGALSLEVDGSVVEKLSEEVLVGGDDGTMCGLLASSARVGSSVVTGRDPETAGKTRRRRKKLAVCCVM